VAVGGIIPEKDFVVAWGLDQYTPEASAGIPLSMVSSLNFRRRRREASPRPIHGEISASWFQADWTDSQAMGILGIQA